MMIKRKFFATALCLGMTFILSAAANDWKLVWADEFDKPGKPNPENWKPENTGFLRNKELQWYTDSRENAYVKDGFLHLVAKKETKPNPWYKKGSDNWKHNRPNIEVTSAGLISKDRIAFQYGRIEMRAKLPKGQGVWPAFWTIGTDKNQKGWPGVGEIDIFEYLEREGKGKLQGALHWKPADARHRQKNKGIRDRNFTDGFHIFAIEWDPEKIVYFFDKDPFFTAKLEDCSNGTFNAFRTPHFLLLNLAIGGALGGKVEDSIFPAHYIVDYIRVYQKDGSGSKILRGKIE